MTFPESSLASFRFAELERTTRRGKRLTESEKQDLLAVLDEDEPWTLRLHVVRLLGRSTWGGEDYRRVTDYLLSQAEGTNRFVTAWAIDSLARVVVPEDEANLSRLLELIRAGMEGDSSAVRVRCRHALSRLRK